LHIDASGTLCKKLESGIFGTHFLKMQILRFHNFIVAKIGIPKIGILIFSNPSRLAGIPILAIHPDRDPNFSDPNLGILILAIVTPF
jgi:hypothetical protein